MMTPLQLIEKIDEFTVATEDQSRRPYLGASDVGERCLRKLYYKFRWVGQEKFDGRMLRLFARGDREETEIVRILRGIGLEVHTPNEGNKEDFQFSDCDSHFRGTCDGTILIPDEQGIADEDYAILECKTYSTERFKKLKQVGVQESDPSYFSQLQVYMGELGLAWTLFYAVAKETDEIFIQWVSFDRIHFETCLNKAEAVINAQVPPERISNDPNTFSCRYCHLTKICHSNEPIPDSQKHCRNCINGHPSTGGSWECSAGHPFGTCCGDYWPITGPV